MKTKITVLIVLVVAIAGYWAYNNFFKGGADEDEKNIRASFSAMSIAIATKNVNTAKKFLAPAFSDKKISKEDFLQVLAAPRSAYSARIKTITTQGDFASISYVRTEARGEDEEPYTAQIIGETWVRDKKNPAIWKLHKLAPNDKWFRSLELPGKKPKVKKAEPKGPVLGTLKRAKRSRSMEPGERYSSVGKRDPFRPLILVAEGPEEEGKEVCDPERPREILESYDLMSLKLAGIIQGAKEPVALIEAPDGKGYTVSKNMHLGKRCGKIIDIQSDYLLVQEQVRKVGAKGEAVFELVETPLKLRPEEG